MATLCSFSRLSKTKNCVLFARQARLYPIPAGPSRCGLKSRPISQTSARGVSEKRSKSQEVPQAEDYGVPRTASVDRTRTILTAVLVLGVAITAYGIYDIYGVMTMWPKEIRQDLRDGLKARHRGDLLLSTQYLSSAFEKAKAMPLGEFGHHPLLKLSGIAITLSSTLEADHRPEQAYRIYEDALWLMRTAYLKLPPGEHPEVGIESLKLLHEPEKMRAVTLAYKLGEMAEAMKRPKDEEEKWLSFAVEAVLSTVMQVPVVAGAEVAISAGGENLAVIAEELGLPRWVAKHDLAAPFEALASFYAREGKNEYALPLYLQAISILIPPSPTVSTVEDRCRGAQLMGNVADLILSRGVNDETIAQAESWAKKGLDVTTVSRSMTSVKRQVCEIAYAVLLYNVAMTQELSGDAAHARELFRGSLDQSKAIGLEEGIEHAKAALHKLDTGVENISPFFPSEGD